MYVCSDCLTPHRTLLGVTGCCCPAADGDDDTLPTVTLGYD